ncbi:MAG: hypothetical protein Q9179_007315 [Wetmoreana sp. 5 TL-2023]
MSDNTSTSEQEKATQGDSSTLDTMTQLSSGAELHAASSNGSGPSEGDSANGVSADTDDTAGGKEDADATVASTVTKTSLKKRAAGNTATDASPKKRRAPTKKNVPADTTSVTTATPKAKKGRTSKAEETASPEPKIEHDSDHDHESAGDEVGTNGDVPAPVTPGKGSRTTKSKAAAEPKTPKAPKTPKNTNGTKGNQGSPTPKSTERKRSAAGKVADKVALPTDWAHASAADKALVQMKEDKKPWSEIRAMWLERTGQDTAGSTLPNR